MRKKKMLVLGVTLCMALSSILFTGCGNVTNIEKKETNLSRELNTKSDEKKIPLKDTKEENEEVDIKNLLMVSTYEISNIFKSKEIVGDLENPDSSLFLISDDGIMYSPDFVSYCEFEVLDEANAYFSITIRYPNDKISYVTKYEGTYFINETKGTFIYDADISYKLEVNFDVDIATNEISNIDAFYTNFELESIIGTYVCDEYTLEILRGGDAILYVGEDSYRGSCFKYEEEWNLVVYGENGRLIYDWFVDFYENTFSYEEFAVG